ncbi:hypothetical protein K2X30_06645 [bacterium]|jgi:hypothetical protein|nr:hypothetical protein [bacterium]
MKKSIVLLSVLTAISLVGLNQKSFSHEAEEETPFTEDNGDGYGWDDDRTDESDDDSAPDDDSIEAEGFIDVANKGPGSQPGYRVPKIKCRGNAKPRWCRSSFPGRSKWSCKPCGK